MYTTAEINTSTMCFNAVLTVSQLENNSKCRLVDCIFGISVLIMAEDADTNDIFVYTKRIQHFKPKSEVFFDSPLSKSFAVGKLFGLELTVRPLKRH